MHTCIHTCIQSKWRVFAVRLLSSCFAIASITISSHKGGQLYITPPDLPHNIECIPCKGGRFESTPSAHQNNPSFLNLHMLFQSELCFFVLDTQIKYWGRSLGKKTTQQIAVPSCPLLLGTACLSRHPQPSDPLEMRGNVASPNTYAMASTVP